MGNAIDITGQRFGRLTVLERAGSYRICGESQTTLALWRCRCDCGTECVVLGQNLRRGQTRSCGCLRNDMLRERAARKKQLKMYGLTLEEVH